ALRQLRAEFRVAPQIFAIIRRPALFRGLQPLGQHVSELFVPIHVLRGIRVHGSFGPCSSSNRRKFLRPRKTREATAERLRPSVRPAPAGGGPPGGSTPPPPGWQRGSRPNASAGRGRPPCRTACWLGERCSPAKSASSRAEDSSSACCNDCSRLTSRAFAPK